MYPIHGRGRTIYTALARRCTRSVHAVNGRVHGTYNAVHMGGKDGRVHGTRPCTGCVHDRDRVTDGPPRDHAECMKKTASAQIAERFEYNRVLWAFHTIQLSSFDQLTENVK